jgi:NAD(P)-dependent dehydrogenase (short-subunit alcohol dehydrogenase family)
VSGRLRGKVSIVTGAGQGIGRATALAFAGEDAVVVVADRNTVTGPAVAKEIEESGAQAVFEEVDVSNQHSCDYLAAAAIERFGRIDVLVANAGVNVFSEPLSLSEAEWRRCLSVDLDGVWFSVRSVLPSMLGQGMGSIVVMASCHSFGIIPNCFPYPVAKHGVVGLVRALGVQYAAQGIRVNAIAPGYVETELAQQYWTTFRNPEAERARVCRLHPTGRLGRPDEVAMTAVFLASDEAPFINATTIQIDGGRSAVYHD